MQVNAKLLYVYRQKISESISKEGIGYLNRMLKFRIFELERKISEISDHNLIEAVALDNFIYELAEKNRDNPLVQEYIKIIETIVKKYPYSYDVFLISKFNIINYFSQETKIKIKNYNHRVKEIINKLDNNLELNADETSMIENYFIELLPTKDSREDERIKKYLDNKLRIVASYCCVENNQLKYRGRIVPRESFLHLLTKYCIYDGLKVYGLSLDTTLIFCGKIQDSIKPAFGRANSGINTIALTNLYDNEKHDLFFRIMACYHETKHIQQKNSLSQNGASKSMYYEIRLKDLFYYCQSVIKYYNGKSEYFINYDNHEIEHDANRAGFYMLLTWMDRIGSKTLADYYKLQWNKKFNEQQSNSKKDNNGNQYPTWIFKFVLLDKIVSENPVTVLNKFPEFKLLYNENGTRKSIISVLSEIQEDFINIPSHKINFMLDYLLYYFNQKGVYNYSNIKQDLENTPNRSEITRKFYVVVRQCAWNIKDCVYLYDNSKDKETLKERIDCLLKVIEQCLVLINKMDTKVKEDAEKYVREAQETVNNFKNQHK